MCGVEKEKDKQNAHLTFCLCVCALFVCGFVFCNSVSPNPLSRTISDPVRCGSLRAFVPLEKTRSDIVIPRRGTSGVWRMDETTSQDSGIVAKTDSESSSSSSSSGSIRHGHKQNPNCVPNETSGDRPNSPGNEWNEDVISAVTFDGEHDDEDDEAKTSGDANSTAWIAPNNNNDVIVLVDDDDETPKGLLSQQYRLGRPTAEDMARAALACHSY